VLDTAIGNRADATAYSVAIQANGKNVSAGRGDVSGHDEHALADIWGPEGRGRGH